MKTMFKLKKAPLTLVEMLLVLGIISFITAIVGLNIRGLLKEQRFKMESAVVLDTLRLAQDLMLITHSDIHVRFTKDPKTHETFYSFELEKPLSSGWMRELSRRRPPLKAIQWVEFDDQLTGIKMANNVVLHFLSGGSVMSQGILRLADDIQNPTHQSFVCLPGHPAPLVSGNATCPKTNNQDILKNLTFYTQREIMERDQKNALSR